MLDRLYRVAAMAEGLEVFRGVVPATAHRPHMINMSSGAGGCARDAEINDLDPLPGPYPDVATGADRIIVEFLAGDPLPGPAIMGPARRSADGFPAAVV